MSKEIIDDFMREIRENKNEFRRKIIRRDDIDEDIKIEIDKMIINDNYEGLELYLDKINKKEKKMEENYDDNAVNVAMQLELQEKIDARIRRVMLECILGDEYKSLICKSLLYRVFCNIFSEVFNHSSK